MWRDVSFECTCCAIRGFPLDENCRFFEILIKETGGKREEAMIEKKRNFASLGLFFFDRVAEEPVTAAAAAMSHKHQY